MSKMNNQFNKELSTGSIGGDEDFLYEQYLAQEKMNEEVQTFTKEEYHSYMAQLKDPKSFNKNRQSFNSSFKS